jgi:periplasmic divalent cation tolerance protein
MAEECIQVFTTTETRGAAEKIAKALIEKRLAARAQIFGPLSSMYWWKGKLENSEEWGGCSRIPMSFTMNSKTS